MAINDYVRYKPHIETKDGCTRYGTIIDQKCHGEYGVYIQILFADGIVDDSYLDDVDILTDKQYFQLRLGAKITK